MTDWDDDRDEDDGDDGDDGGDWDVQDGPVPDDDDDEDDGPADTVPCPFCGRAVYESADVCPGCHSFVGAADGVPARRPWWMIVGLVLCLIGTAAACACRMW